MSVDVEESVVYDSLTEVSHLTMHLPPGGNEGPGTVVSFHSELRGSADETIGRTVEGFGLVYLDPEDKRVKERVTATDEFEDGSIFWAGTVDIASVVRGEAQIFRAFGISGRYRGMVGTRSITIIGRQDERTSVFGVKIDLHR